MKYKNGILKNKVVCPRCDGNGFLYSATLQPINIPIVICDECEAVWPSNSKSITNDNFEDFTTYIESFGYTYDEVLIANVNYDWFQNHPQ